MARGYGKWEIRDMLTNDLVMRYLTAREAARIIRYVFPTRTLYMQRCE